MDKNEAATEGTTAGETENKNKIFDYRALRLVIGILALALPLVVGVISSRSLPSISASYYTEAQDVFVGILFFVAAFLFAYKGDFRSEARASSVASVAAILVACFPTSEGDAMNWKGVIHYISAAVLFGILAYFCFGPFRKKLHHVSGKKWRRERIYFWCGVFIVASMLMIGVGSFLVDAQVSKAYAITYWAEFAALWFFGIAWFVAGKALPVLTDDSERLKIF